MNERQIRRTRDHLGSFSATMGWADGVYRAELRGARDVQFVAEQNGNSWTASITGTLDIIEDKGRAN